MNKSSIKKLIKENSNSFYVYILRRPDNTPFYIGKGYGLRILGHEKLAINNIGPNKHKNNLIRKILKSNDKINYDIIGFFQNEKIAFLYEKELIDLYGRVNLKNGILVNLTDGGEGSSGYVPTTETIKKISENNAHYGKGKTFSVEYRKKLSENNVGNRGRKLPKEWKDKISKSLKGRPSPRKGQVVTQETRDKMSKVRKGKPSPRKGKKYPRGKGIK